MLATSGCAPGEEKPGSEPNSKASVSGRSHSIHDEVDGHISLVGPRVMCGDCPDIAPVAVEVEGPTFGDLPYPASFALSHHDPRSIRRPRQVRTMDLFEGQWRTYRKIVDHDWMEHRAITTAATEAVRSWMERHPERRRQGRLPLRPIRQAIQPKGAFVWADVFPMVALSERPDYRSSGLMRPPIGGRSHHPREDATGGHSRCHVSSIVEADRRRRSETIKEETC
jgi:hypothetical protein